MPFHTFSPESIATSPLGLISLLFSTENLAGASSCELKDFKYFTNEDLDIAISTKRYELISGW